MKYYELQKDEVPLFRGEALVLQEDCEETTIPCEIILTNQNFVITKIIKSLFKKEFETNVYEFALVKVYKDSPYIVQKNNKVEIYFENSEQYISFNNTKEAKDFTNKALKAVSGNSKFVRIIKKVQQEINETNEALNIDIVGTAVAVAKTASELPNVGKKAKKLGFISNLIPKKKEKDTPLLSSTDNKVEKMKELKLLLDEGAITEEEFQQLKQEYLKN